MPLAGVLWIFQPHNQVQALTPTITAPSALRCGSGHSLQIGVQVGDGLLAHFHLDQLEAGEVVVVGPREGDHSGVLCGSCEAPFPASLSCSGVVSLQCRREDPVEQGWPQQRPGLS